MLVISQALIKQSIRHLVTQHKSVPASFQHTLEQGSGFDMAFYATSLCLRVNVSLFGHLTLNRTKIYNPELAFVCILLFSIRTATFFSENFIPTVFQCCPSIK